MKGSVVLEAPGPKAIIQQGHEGETHINGHWPIKTTAMRMDKVDQNESLQRTSA